MEWLIEILEIVREVYTLFPDLKAGHAAAWGVISTLLIRLYRTQELQKVLPKKARWASWPMWLRKVLVNTLAGGSATVAALVVGNPVLGALGIGAMATFSAFTAHKTTRLLGSRQTPSKSDYSHSIKIPMSLLIPKPRKRKKIFKVGK